LNRNNSSQSQNLLLGIQTAKLLPQYREHQIYSHLQFI